MSSTTSETIVTNATADLSAAGVSIWLDDINRENLQNDKLERLIEERNVVGVTTNPTIFATALSKGNAYDEQLEQLKGNDLSVEDAVFEITTRDVADASDLFTGIYRSTLGQDGRVSIEVSPGAAHDTNATIAEAKRLWAKVDHENAMIKIPATDEGLAAIQACIADGISVNVTLIFGLARYKQVVEAYLSGLEAAHKAGRDLSAISSVASFFVSRVDTEVNKRLDALADTTAADELRNEVAVANARAAYQRFTELFASERAKALLDEGANLQRPLWASTGVKVAELAPTYYVTSLIAPNTVNTMPEKTLDALTSYDGPLLAFVSADMEAAKRVLTQVEELGIAMDDVSAALEAEGVQKFTDSWSELAETVKRALDA
jgi:transaldolase